MRGRIDLGAHKMANVFRPPAPKSWYKRNRSQKMPGGTKGTYFMLWRIVDGAVRHTLAVHPEYLTQKGRESAVNSIDKRVVGALMGYAAQVAWNRFVRGQDAAPDATVEKTTSPLGRGSRWTRMAAAIASWVRVSKRCTCGAALPTTQRPKFNKVNDNG